MTTDELVQWLRDIHPSAEEVLYGGPASQMAADTIEAQSARLAEAQAVLKYVRAVLPNDHWADDTKRMIDAFLTPPPAPPAARP